MSGANIDPSDNPSRAVNDSDADARLKLTQLKLTEALQRAKFAIAWERAWPHLARFLTVAGLFLVASWAGLWLALPFAARVAGAALFGIAALAVLAPLVRFRWPSREEGLG
ncbi:DUF4175 family protein, partial [Bradyrhizobium sp. Pear77]|uniref:DUF4175 family protein n=1 Tax=Bradyrhizobium altum TaxID=1571202 RepID=UPI0035D75093|nr:DUF4175 family protein [Bradyrhizobium altum]